MLIKSSYISVLGYAETMEKKELTPHYIKEKLRSQYVQQRTTLKLGKAEATESTKNWAVQDYQYIWGS